MTHFDPETNADPEIIADPETRQSRAGKFGVTDRIK
jgi:hypothetical protein